MANSDGIDLRNLQEQDIVPELGYRLSSDNTFRTNYPRQMAYVSKSAGNAGTGTVNCLSPFGDTLGTSTTGYGTVILADGFLSDLWFKSTANTYNTSYVLQVVVDGAVVWSLTVPAGDETASDTSTTVNVSAGSMLYFNIAGTGGGIGSAVLPTVGCILNAT